MRCKLIDINYASHEYNKVQKSKRRFLQLLWLPERLSIAIKLLLSKFYLPSPSITCIFLSCFVLVSCFSRCFSFFACILPTFRSSPTFRPDLLPIAPISLLASLLSPLSPKQTPNRKLLKRVGAVSVLFYCGLHEFDPLFALFEDVWVFFL